MPVHTVPRQGRLVFLDWIRILAFAVLVLYHVGMYYVSWDWHIKSPSTVTALLWLALRAWPAMLDRTASLLDKRLGAIGLVLLPVLALARALLQARFPDTRALIDDWSAHGHFAAMFLVGAVFECARRVRWLGPWFGLQRVSEQAMPGVFARTRHTR